MHVTGTRGGDDSSVPPLRWQENIQQALGKEGQQQRARAVFAVPEDGGAQRISPFQFLPAAWLWPPGHRQGA